MKNVVAAFARRIDALEWMAPKTKAQAKAKLAVLKVGRRLSRQVARLLGPRGRAAATPSATSSARRSSSTGATSRKLGQPVDRSEWVMNAQLVNAVNLPAMNALNFPAGDPPAAVLRSRRARR